jgi:hypothetical protein
MTTENQRYALHAVHDISTDAGHFLAHYSAFKHGDHEAAEFYAVALAELVANTLTESADGLSAPFVLTSPPFAAIPSASHYLAERLITRLNADRASVSLLSYIPLRKRAAGGRHDYSQLAPSDRAASQTRQAELFVDPPPGLRHRHIVVVNDMRVTGHQERVLSDYISQNLSPERVSWLYLAEVAPELARTSPDIENRLNLAGLPTADDYLQFLSSSLWSPTARGVRRILALPVPMIRQVLSSIAHERVVELVELVEAERLGPAGDLLALVDREASRK